ncbi:MAG: hypothetical protein KA175_14730 [Flavobacteriales bacterium]|nr:hypothetical protein [Flavobacteriales bacterium]MBP7409715.1 hypothetical protein [Flavobacteriales bacterium]
MNKVEADIISAMSTMLAFNSTRLRSSGLAYEAPIVDVLKHDESEYSSEVRLVFSRNEEFHDALEFHVYRNGVLLVSLSDVIDWFRGELDAIISSAEKG